MKQMCLKSLRGGCFSSLVQKIAILFFIGMGLGTFSSVNAALLGDNDNGVDNLTYYNRELVTLSTLDTVQGFAYLAGGFSVPASGDIYFRDVAAPVGGSIKFNAATINLESDLMLTSTVVLFKLAGGADQTIKGNGNSIILQGDVALPGSMAIIVSENLVIDGQGHTLTFDSTNSFSVEANKILTLKNMVIKGLDTEQQLFNNAATATVVLQNVVIDLAAGVTAKFNSGNFTIKDMVVVKGFSDSTLQIGDSINLLTINAFSTLCIDMGVTLDYAATSATKFTFSNATAQLYINGGTLKANAAVATSGLQLADGTLLLDNKVTLNNGTNDDKAKGIQFGNGTTDLTVKVLAGAYVIVNGMAYHNTFVAA